MIPGIVAGYPSRQGGVITIASTPPSYGAWGYNIEIDYGATGTLNPVGMTVYPGGAPNPGGLGEMMALAYTQPGNSAPDSFYLVVRGSTTNWPTVNSLPFASLKINGLTIPKSQLRHGGTYGANVGQVYYCEPAIANPFVVGSNTVLFQ
ncbi:hypothetical protein [Pseudomonas indica]|uniref:Uncharacterized protein n=1 Tax=Pseudomonas indica TaxID=137658 RepID=A0A1G8V7F0_9PSED|nr:hypothetical protein [Pseudomonas indica]SDJ61777.1 hypothetical protein SAMN05216186_102118 [Pseudomonas indica]